MKQKTAPMKNILLSALALVIFASVAVFLLSLANYFFPKYEASLDMPTAKILNGLVESGAENAETAFRENYFEMLKLDGLKKWNGDNGKEGGKTLGTVLAVYRATAKNTHAGTLFIETSTKGNEGNEIVLITAVSPSGRLLNLVPRKINDSWYSAADLARFAAYLTQNEVQASALTAVELKPFLHSGGATYTTNGIRNGVVLSARMFETAKSIPVSEGGENG